MLNSWLNVGTLMVNPWLNPGYVNGKSMIKGAVSWKIFCLVLISVEYHIRMDRHSVFNFLITFLVLQIFSVFKYANSLWCHLLTHTKYKLYFTKQEIFKLTSRINSNFTRWPDILPKDTLPKDTLPKDILPNGHFADGHIVERTFCRMDSMTSGLFAEKTFCRNDNLPKIEKF